MVQFPTVGQPEKPQDITGPEEEVEQQKNYDIKFWTIVSF